MSFYIAIVSFIFSVIIALLLMIVGKNMSPGRVFYLAAIHGLTLIAWLASLLLVKHPAGDIWFNYFFLVFICSGVMLSGIVWRIRVSVPLRIYFSLFALTFPLFIFSPSMLVFFLLTSKYTDSLGPAFHAGGNYYIETQNTMMKSDSIPHYKLVRKRGIYHQTIKRDIVFGGKLDSIRVLRLEPGVNILIRGYTSKITFVSNEVDSTETDLNLAPHKVDDVEYHL